MNTLRYFKNTNDARAYRYNNGTGGWIFAPDDGGESILFPPSMPPSAIFNHRAVKGQSGALIGSQ